MRRFIRIGTTPEQWQSRTDLIQSTVEDNFLHPNAHFDLDRHMALIPDDIP